MLTSFFSECISFFRGVNRVSPPIEQVFYQNLSIINPKESTFLKTILKIRGIRKTMKMMQKSVQFWTNYTPYFPPFYSPCFPQLFTP